MAAGWLRRCADDVPAGDRWLGEAEREVLCGLALPRRRADWRLGRLTAKTAVARWLAVDPARIAVLAGPGGAPAAWLDGAPAPVALSLTHRADCAVALVADGPGAVGCDLERIEPRSAAFVGDWLAEPEQAAVAAAGDDGPARVANLVWTAKEAAAKVRGEGLRLDVRGAVTTLGGLDGGPDVDGWRPLAVRWPDAEQPTRGWWREAPGWVLSVAAAAPGPPPEALDDDQEEEDRDG